MVFWYLFVSAVSSWGIMATQLLGTLSVSTLPIKFSSKLSFSQSESLSLSIPYSSKFISISAISPPLSLIYNGRGDRKTAKGKRFAHSFGNARPRDKKKGRGPPKVPMPPSPRKKDRVDDEDR